MPAALASNYVALFTGWVFSSYIPESAPPLTLLFTSPVHSVSKTRCSKMSQKSAGTKKVIYHGPLRISLAEGASVTGSRDSAIVVISDPGIPKSIFRDSQKDPAKVIFPKEGEPFLVHSYLRIDTTGKPEPRQIKHAGTGEKAAIRSLLAEMREANTAESRVETRVITSANFAIHSPNVVYEIQANQIMSSVSSGSQGSPSAHPSHDGDPQGPVRAGSIQGFAIIPSANQAHYCSAGAYATVVPFHHILYGSIRKRTGSGDAGPHGDAGSRAGQAGRRAIDLQKVAGPQTPATDDSDSDGTADRDNESTCGEEREQAAQREKQRSSRETRRKVPAPEDESLDGADSLPKDGSEPTLKQQAPR